MWAKAYMPEYTDSRSNRAIIIDILWIEVIEKNYFAQLSLSGKLVFFAFANHKLKQ